MTELYRRRGEIEQAFDEIKTVLCHHPAGTPNITLRCKSPKRVVQEVFALLVTYGLIRRTMALAAAKEGISPTDLGFTDSLRVIAQTAPIMIAAPAARLADLFEQMLRDVAANILRRPRVPRSYPRAIRRSNSKYPILKKRRKQVA